MSKVTQTKNKNHVYEENVLVNIHTKINESYLLQQFCEFFRLSTNLTRWTCSTSSTGWGNPEPAWCRPKSSTHLSTSVWRLLPRDRGTQPTWGTLVSTMIQIPTKICSSKYFCLISDDRNKTDYLLSTDPSRPDPIQWVHVLKWNIFVATHRVPCSSCTSSVRTRCRKECGFQVSATVFPSSWWHSWGGVVPQVSQPSLWGKSGVPQVRSHSSFRIKVIRTPPL